MTFKVPLKKWRTNIRTCDKIYLPALRIRGKIEHSDVLFAFYFEASIRSLDTHRMEIRSWTLEPAFANTSQQFFNRHKLIYRSFCRLGPRLLHTFMDSFFSHCWHEKSLINITLEIILTILWWSKLIVRI